MDICECIQEGTGAGRLGCERGGTAQDGTVETGTVQASNNNVEMVEDGESADEYPAEAMAAVRVRIVLFAFACVQGVATFRTSTKISCRGASCRTCVLCMRLICHCYTLLELHACAICLKPPRTVGQPLL